MLSFSLNHQHLHLHPSLFVLRLTHRFPPKRLVGGVRRRPGDLGSCAWPDHRKVTHHFSRVFLHLEWPDEEKGKLLLWPLGAAQTPIGPGKERQTDSWKPNARKKKRQDKTPKLVGRQAGRQILTAQVTMLFNSLNGAPASTPFRSRDLSRGRPFNPPLPRLSTPSPAVLVCKVHSSVVLGIHNGTEPQRPSEQTHLPPCTTTLT